MGKLQEYKSALYDSKYYKGPTVDIEWELGDETLVLEVRSPKVKHTFKGFGEGGKQLEIVRGIDIEGAILDCVYLKETGEKFFDKTDLPMLAESAMVEDGIMTKISQAFQRLGEVLEVDEGN